MTTPYPSSVEEFMKLLQEKVDESLDFPPNNQVLDSPF